MARAKKDGKYLNCYLDLGVHNKLSKYCKLNHETKTAVIEKALLKYFESLKQSS